MTRPEFSKSFRVVLVEIPKFSVVLIHLCIIYRSDEEMEGEILAATTTTTTSVPRAEGGSSTIWCWFEGCFLLTFISQYQRYFFSGSFF